MKSIEKEERPWGRFFVIHDEKKYKLKRIEVDSGGRLSYQYHKKRSETWTIIEGEALVTLDDKIFNRPNIPIVDGRGNIWSPWSTDEKELYNYTLNDQITSTYDFSKSISVSLKEFCPDHIVLLGPGNH